MKTVGEILRAARLGKKWSLEDLSRHTRIQERFLAALEESQYDHLPEVPFVKGFIQTAALELGLKPDVMVSIFRRDFGVDRKGNIIPRELEEANEKEFHWTPKLTMLSAFIVVLTTFGGYLIWELHLLASPPILELTLPKDQSVVSEGVVIQGKTEPSATVSINGQEIKKNRSGSFSQVLLLPEGGHILSVTATGQNKKVTTIERAITVKHD